MLKEMKKYNYENFYFYLFLIIPLLAIYLIFFVVPVVASMFFSFTDYNGFSLNFDFVGFKNYQVAFKDTVFRKAVLNTLIYATLSTVLQNGIAIFFAVALNAKMKSKHVLRVLLFAPCTLAPVVVAYIWQFIYMPEGLINTVLGTTKVWLGDTSTALVAVVIAHVWIWIGYSSMIYLANLQMMDEQIMEASKIDGASKLQKFFYITLPMLAPSITINVTLAFTQSLKAFDIVFAMTGGGPLNATETVGTYAVYNMGRGLNGYASALTVLLSVIIIISGTVLINYFKKKEEAIYE